MRHLILLSVLGGVCVLGGASCWADTMTVTFVDNPIASVFVGTGTFTFLPDGRIQASFDAIGPIVGFVYNAAPGSPAYIASDFSPSFPLDPSPFGGLGDSSGHYNEGFMGAIACQTFPNPCPSSVSLILVSPGTFASVDDLFTYYSTNPGLGQWPAQMALLAYKWPYMGYVNFGPQVPAPPNGTPEPATVSLVCCGLVTIFTAHRRRSSRKKSVV